jgi:DNA-directed RNA polymerase beta' subunit
MSTKQKEGLPSKTRCVQNCFELIEESSTQTYTFPKDGRTSPKSGTVATIATSDTGDIAGTLFEIEYGLAPSSAPVAKLASYSYKIPSPDEIRAGSLGSISESPPALFGSACTLQQQKNETQRKNITRKRNVSTPQGMHACSLCGVENCGCSGAYAHMELPLPIPLLPKYMGAKLKLALNCICFWCGKLRIDRHGAEWNKYMEYQNARFAYARKPAADHEVEWFQKLCKNVKLCGSYIFSSADVNEEGDDISEAAYSIDDENEKEDDDGKGTEHDDAALDESGLFRACQNHDSGYEEQLCQQPQYDFAWDGLHMLRFAKQQQRRSNQRKYLPFSFLMMFDLFSRVSQADATFLGFSSRPEHCLAEVLYVDLALAPAALSETDMSEQNRGSKLDWCYTRIRNAISTLHDAIASVQTKMVQHFSKDAQHMDIGSDGDDDKRTVMKQEQMTRSNAGTTKKPLCATTSEAAEHVVAATVPCEHALEHRTLETTPLYNAEHEMYVVRAYKNYGFDPYLHETTCALATNVVREVFLLWDHEQPFLQESKIGLDRYSHKYHDDTNRRTASIAASLGKKEGSVRGTMQAKRVDNNSRLVATPNTDQAVDDVTLPVEILMQQTYPSQVTRQNLSACRRLIINGPDIYPGANFVIDMNTRAKIDLHFVNRMHFAQCVLAPGMIIRRHLQAGDPTFVNRPPTLTKDNMNCQRIRVGSGSCAQIHPFAMSPYDMDGDGDHVSNFFPQSDEVVIEGQILLPLKNNIIHSATLEPQVCFSESALTGAYSLSQPNLFLDARDFARLASCSLARASGPLRPALVVHSPARDGSVVNVTENPSFVHISASARASRVYYTGLQLLSTSLPDTFTYVGCAQTTLGPLCPTEMVTYVNAFRAADALCLENERVAILEQWLSDGTGAQTSQLDDCTKIVRGEILITTPSTLWKNTSGGVLHALAYTYSGKDVLERMKHQSDMLHTWADEEGKSFSIDNLRISDHYREKDNNAGELFNIRTQFPDLPSSMLQHTAPDAEQQQLAYARDLSAATMQYHKALWESAKIDYDANSIVDLIRSGACGSAQKCTEMSASLTQQYIEGQRLGLKYADERISAYFSINEKTLQNYEARKSMHHWRDVLQSRGYIESSYMSGLNPMEMHAHLMTARHTMLSATLYTKKSGHLQRELDKAIQRHVVQYDFSVRSPEGDIYELICAQHGFSPERMYPYNLDCALLSKQNIMCNFANFILHEFDMVPTLWKLEQQCASQHTDTACVTTSLEQLRGILDSEMHLIISLIQKVRQRKSASANAGLFMSPSSAFIVYLPVRLNAIVQAAWEQQEQQQQKQSLPENVSQSSLLCASYVIRSTRALIEHIYACYRYQHPRYYELECALVTALSSKRVILSMHMSRTTFDRVIQHIRDEVMLSFVVPGEAIGSRAAQYLGSFDTKQHLDKSRTSCAHGLPGDSFVTLQHLLYLKKDSDAHTMEIYTKSYHEAQPFLSDSECAWIEHAVAAVVRVQTTSTQSNITSQAMDEARLQECRNHAFAQFVAQDLLPCTVQDLCTNHECYAAEENVASFSIRFKQESQTIVDGDVLLPLSEHAASRECYNGYIRTTVASQDSKPNTMEPCLCMSMTDVTALYTDPRMHVIKLEISTRRMQTAGTDVFDLVQRVALSLRAYMLKTTGQALTCGGAASESCDPLSPSSSLFGTVCKNSEQSHCLVVWSAPKKRQQPHMLFSMWVTPADNGDIRTLHICLNAVHPLRRAAAVDASIDMNTSQEELRAFMLEYIFRVRIKGIHHIHAAFVHPRNIHVYDAVKMETRIKQVFPILTSGSNLSEVLLHPFVDVRYTTSSNPIEIASAFGIAAAEAVLLRQLAHMFPSIPHDTYFRQVAKFMTHRGTLMDVRSATFNKHYQQGHHVGMGFLHLQTSEQPVPAIFDAAFSHAVDPLVGASESMLTSNIAPVGTGFGSFDITIERILSSTPFTDCEETKASSINDTAVVQDLTHADVRQLIGRDTDEYPVLVTSNVDVSSEVAQMMTDAATSSSGVASGLPSQTKINTFIEDYQARCAQYKRKCRDWLSQEKAQEEMQQRAMYASLAPTSNAFHPKKPMIGKQKRFKPAASSASVTASNEQA